MSTYLHSIFKNLKPFNFKHHFKSHLVDKKWILVNGIAEEKSIYTFKTNEVLEIQKNKEQITACWSINQANEFQVETEDGAIYVDAYFKDDDIFILQHQNKRHFAMFVHHNDTEDAINTIEDLQHFLREKYEKKVTKAIVEHEFFYIENSEEHGPFTVEELAEKVDRSEINRYCFVRDINEADYSSRLRINDLIIELKL